MCACVARKTRLETYVDRELEQQIEALAENRDTSVSALLRESVRKEVQRESMEDN